MNPFIEANSSNRLKFVVPVSMTTNKENAIILDNDLKNKKENYKHFDDELVLVHNFQKKYFDKINLFLNFQIQINPNIRFSTNVFVFWGALILNYLGKWKR